MTDQTDTDFEGLVAGYHRFRDGAWQRQRARWSELKDGQSPKVMVVACSDSRVDPSQIFDVSPGEIFVVRNVANLVPPFENDNGRHGVSAALEFAVTQLQVGEVVVMGHGACGGCKAALTHAFEGATPGQGGFVAHWVDILDEARDRVIAKHGKGDAAITQMEHEAVRVSLANLKTFPFVSERLADGRLSLRGAHFAIADGVLRVMGDDGAFVPA